MIRSFCLMKRKPIVITPMRPRRMEVLNGPERRRKWSDEAKIVIVAEALADGVVVSDVARRHGISPSQLFGWMRQFRDAALATIAPPLSPMFTPAVVVATVHIRGAVDAKTLAAVLKALRVLG